MPFFLLWVHSNKIICLHIFLICTLILNATINWEHAVAPTLKITAKLAQYHHMTSRQEKDFSHCQSCRVLSIANFPVCSSSLKLKRQTSTDVHTLSVLSCFGVWHHCGPNRSFGPGFWAWSCLAPTRSINGWTSSSTIHHQCLVRLPLFKRTIIH